MLANFVTYENKYRTLKLIKVWLPQQRRYENELLDCSCLIHSGNTNELKTTAQKSSTGEVCLYRGIPELWNLGVTQLLASFPELIGTCDCVSVAQNLVACVMPTQVCFLNVLEKAIVARTPFPEHILKLYKRTKIEVIACSSLYHVLIRKKERTYLLEQANSVDLSSGILKNITRDDNSVMLGISVACFSPNGQSLAFRVSYKKKMLYILDIATLNVRGKFSLRLDNFVSEVKFVDEEHLLCDEYNDCLCLINVKTCNILTCINLGLSCLWDFFTCRNTVGIVTYDREYKTLKLIKLWLPQQRGYENELPECSCLIHSRNINEITNFLMSVLRT